MNIDNVLASVAVKNIKEASTWYERLLGRRADSVPMEGLMEWRFPRGGWLQVYERPERAGAGSFTLAVDDLEEVIAHVEALHVDASERTSNPSVKTLMISDPDGNHIAFAEAIDRRMAR